MTLVLGLSLGASCGQKSSSNPDDAKNVLVAMDNAEPDDSPKEPIKGVDLSDLSEDQTARYEKLIDSLISPCGKTHSLRKSANTDSECRRALFAARYLVFLLEEAASDNEIREFYGNRYVEKRVHNFELKDAPHLGAADAKVAIVEFFDFTCPACRASVPLLHALIEEFDGEVVLYYKQFPLEGHGNSGLAAMAALAAYKKGKYQEMHERLLENPRNQSRRELLGYAKELGLDLGRFTLDLDAAEAQVVADKKAGITAGVMATPSFYINGREYTDPIVPQLLKMWLEEEVAINR